MKPWVPPELLNRLAADPANRTTPITLGNIDFSKPFVPEHHTQLYYSPAYKTLSDAQRLRYNQLFGIRINEFVMVVEGDVIEQLLAPLKRDAGIRNDPEMLACIDTMIAEEKSHYQGFLAFNRACLPDVFANGRERYFSELPAAAKVIFKCYSALGRFIAFPLWYLMVMEEHAATFSHDMMSNPETESLGPYEPHFLELHKEHLKDEYRHVQLDGQLIERCLDHAKPWKRALGAYLFKVMMKNLTQVGPNGSGAKVIRRLVQDCPELKDREGELIQAIVALGKDPVYHKSLFNRKAMPLTFGVFDRTFEFNDLQRYVVGYDRPAAQ